MAFHVGQRVVCVTALQPSMSGAILGASVPRKGEVVTVRAIDEFRPGDVKLRLVEHLNEGIHAPGWLPVEPGFAVRHFRPLSETRLDQFRAHLAPAPKQKTGEMA